MFQSANSETKNADARAKAPEQERGSALHIVHPNTFLGSRRAGTPSKSTALPYLQPRLDSLRGVIGNQAMLRLLRNKGLTSKGEPGEVTRIPTRSSNPLAIQTKLAINTPGDQYEQEADRVADQVMRMPDPQAAVPVSGNVASGVQRKCGCGGTCSRCQSEQRENEHLQLKRFGSGEVGQTAAPPIVHQVLNSPGQPLDPSTRAFMEPRFGHDFSDVRVHSSSIAQRSAEEINARAYTAGHNIVFGARQFVPGSHESLSLLAHELAHVVQQRAAYIQGIQRDLDLDFGNLQRRQIGRAEEGNQAVQARSDVEEKHWNFPELVRCILHCHFSSTAARRWYTQYFIQDLYRLNNGKDIDSESLQNLILQYERLFQNSRSKDEVAQIPQSAGTTGWVDQELRAETQTRQGHQLIEEFTTATYYGEVDKQLSSIEVHWKQLAAIARDRDLAKDWVAQGDEVVKLIRIHTEGAIDASTHNDESLRKQYLAVLKTDLIAYRYISYHSFFYQNLSRLRQELDAVSDSLKHDPRTFTGRVQAEKDVANLQRLRNSWEKAEGVLLSLIRTDVPYKLHSASGTDVSITLTTGADRSRGPEMKRVMGDVIEAEQELEGLTLGLNMFLENAFHEGLQQAEQAVEQYYDIKQFLDSAQQEEQQDEEEATKENQQKDIGTTTDVVPIANPSPKEDKKKKRKCRAPLGTLDDPIPITWFKLRHDYFYPEKITFHNDGRVHEMHRDDPYATLPDGTPVGVYPWNWPYCSKTLIYQPEPRNKAAEQFRYELQRSGYNWLAEGTQADHVNDVAWQGPDEIHNIWPLESSTNASAGSTQNLQQRITFCPSDDGVPIVNQRIADVAPLILGKYFIITAQSFHSGGPPAITCP